MAKTSLEEAKLNSLVKKQVIEVLREFLNDPDFGLELRPEFETRLRKSIRSRKADKTRSLTEVLKQYEVH
ncbi:MAG: hypothetical protein HYT03_02440 [Candidatus Harrisonbacteria bacterium]|nr:hypothetical protein [Candidatus Harrisonbacteria bacterium]